VLSDIENVRKMVALLGDEGFVEALENAEKLVDEADDTLTRVEQICSSPPVCSSWVCSASPRWS
jgi:hypothetical protein